MNRTLRTTFSLLAIGWGMACPAQYPLWGDLKPGKYAIGFRSFWTSDPARTFAFKFSDGSRFGPGRQPRPILIDVWYPAQNKGRTMRESDYLGFLVKGKSSLARFTHDLAGINREVVSHDVVGKALRELTKEDRGKLDRYLGFPVAAIRNGLPLKGKYPVVVYVQGYGSSLQDNSALCEYLASNGYIVLGSAYQDETGKMIADKETTCSDVRCLLSAARSMPNADLDHVALIGHSGGAQSSIVYAGLAGAVIDAVVSLDTTQDYYFNDRSGFQSYIQRVSPSSISIPMLIAANRSAIFELTDSMANSERLYLAVDELGHDEYTSQGYGRTVVLDTENRARVRQRYTALCQTELKFLDATLKRQGSVAALKAPSNFSLERLPRGTRTPPPYTKDNAPPTPRQMRILVASDPQRAIELIGHFAKTHPKAAIYEGQLAFAIVDHFLEQKDSALARQFSDAYRSASPDLVISAKTFVRWGDIYAGFKATQEAIHNYEKALLFDPENQEAQTKLEALKKR